MLKQLRNYDTNSLITKLLNYKITKLISNSVIQEFSNYSV